MKEQGLKDTEISFIEMNNEERKLLLDILDYKIDDEGFIVDNRTKQHHICPMSKTKVRINDSSILPGSTIIINTSALTLSEYFSRYLDER